MVAEQSVGRFDRPGGTSSRPQSDRTATAVIFDLGGVLIDWNPEYLYRNLIQDPAERAWFLAQVCSPRWNAEQDRGRSFEEAVRVLTAQNPDRAALIEAYWTRWPEMLGDVTLPTSQALAGLREAGTSLYALTNWSRETFPIALSRYPELALFSDIVVSGECGMAKPDPEIFRYSLDRFGLAGSSPVYIDDSPVNVEAARAVGMIGIHFTSPSGLRARLVELGLLPQTKADPRQARDRAGDGSDGEAAVAAR